MPEDPFHDVCKECGRHIVKTGHAPDCSNAEDTDDAQADGGTDTRDVHHDRGRPVGSQIGRQVNRNAVRASLHERGFIGVSVTMHTRDYALVSLSDVPEPRQEVAEVFFEYWDAAFREPDVDGYAWGVRL